MTLPTTLIPERPRRRPLTGAQFAARFEAEKARQQRRYCDAFAFWRTCKLKRCRRDSGCRGDANQCLTRPFGAVPQQTQWQVRQDILNRTPRNIGAPELAARQCMPRDFYAETAAEAVGEYLARFRTKPAMPPSPSRAALRADKMR
jgi:hypothetical protein